MAYVIAEPCMLACAAECVSVCPVDCIHGPPEIDEQPRTEQSGTRAPGLQRYIDPDTCTSCAACASVCPTEAIFDEDDLPARWRHYRALNAAFFASRGLNGG